MLVQNAQNKCEKNVKKTVLNKLTKNFSHVKFSLTLNAKRFYFKREKYL